MKFLVASDIHGSLYYLNKIIEQFENTNADKLILLGDLYYHGPRNPLPKDYNPMEVSKKLNQIKDKLMVIKGNCDAEVYEMISDFPFEEHLTLNINEKIFYFTHCFIKYYFIKSSYSWLIISFALFTSRYGITYSTSCHSGVPYFRKTNSIL